MFNNIETGFCYHPYSFQQYRLCLYTSTVEECKWIILTKKERNKNENEQSNKKRAK